MGCCISFFNRKFPQENFDDNYDLGTNQNNEQRMEMHDRENIFNKKRMDEYLNAMNNPNSLQIKEPQAINIRNLNEKEQVDQTASKNAITNNYGNENFNNQNNDEEDSVRKNYHEENRNEAIFDDKSLHEENKTVYMDKEVSNHNTENLSKHEDNTSPGPGLFKKGFSNQDGDLNNSVETEKLNKSSFLGDDSNSKSYKNSSGKSTYQKENKDAKETSNKDQLKSKKEQSTDGPLYNNTEKTIRPNTYKRGEIISNKPFKKVYQCQQINKGGLCAVKTYFLLPEVFISDYFAIDLKNQVKKEIQDLADFIIKFLTVGCDLDHKNLVKYYGARWSVDIPGGIDIISEFIPGCLGDMLKQYGAFDERPVAKYMKQVQEAIKYLHEQDLFIRNLKASNILADKEGQVKICDHICPEETRLLEEMLQEEDRKIRELNPELYKNEQKNSNKKYNKSGYSEKSKPSYSDNDNLDKDINLLYQAPEIVLDYCRDDFKQESDVWGIGCLTYELLTKYPPYYKQTKGGDYSKIKLIYLNNEKPEFNTVKWSVECQSFLSKCFCFEPSQRPNVNQLLDDPFIKKMSKETNDEKSSKSLSDGNSDKDLTKFDSFTRIQMERMGNLIKTIGSKNKVYNCPNPKKLSTKLKKNKKMRENIERENLIRYNSIREEGNSEESDQEVSKVSEEDVSKENKVEENKYATVEITENFYQKLVDEKRKKEAIKSHKDNDFDNAEFKDVTSNNQVINNFENNELLHPKTFEENTEKKLSNKDMKGDSLNNAEPISDDNEIDGQVDLIAQMMAYMNDEVTNEQKALDYETFDIKNKQNMNDEESSSDDVYQTKNTRSGREEQIHNDIDEEKKIGINDNHESSSNDTVVDQNAELAKMWEFFNNANEDENDGGGNDWNLNKADSSSDVDESDDAKREDSEEIQTYTKNVYENGNKSERSHSRRSSKRLIKAQNEIEKKAGVHYNQSENDSQKNTTNSKKRDSNVSKEQSQEAQEDLQAKMWAFFNNADEDQVDNNNDWNLRKKSESHSESNSEITENSKSLHSNLDKQSELKSDKSIQHENYEEKQINSQTDESKSISNLSKYQNNFNKSNGLRINTHINSQVSSATKLKLNKRTSPTKPQSNVTLGHLNNRLSDNSIVKMNENVDHQGNKYNNQICLFNDVEPTFEDKAQYESLNNSNIKSDHLESFNSKSIDSNKISNREISLINSNNRIGKPPQYTPSRKSHIISERKYTPKAKKKYKGNDLDCEIDSNHENKISIYGSHLEHNNTNKKSSKISNSSRSRISSQTLLADSDSVPLKITMHAKQIGKMKAKKKIKSFENLDDNASSKNSYETENSDSINKSKQSSVSVDRNKDKSKNISPNRSRHEKSIIHKNSVEVIEIADSVKIDEKNEILMDFLLPKNKPKELVLTSNTDLQDLEEVQQDKSVLENKTPSNRSKKNIVIPSCDSINLKKSTIQLDNSKQGEVKENCESEMMGNSSVDSVNEVKNKSESRINNISRSFDRKMNSKSCIKYNNEISCSQSKKNDNTSVKSENNVSPAKSISKSFQGNSNRIMENNLENNFLTNEDKSQSGSYNEPNNILRNQINFGEVVTETIETTPLNDNFVQETVEGEDQQRENTPKDIEMNEKVDFCENLSEISKSPSQQRNNDNRDILRDTINYGEIVTETIEAYQRNNNFVEDTSEHKATDHKESTKTDNIVFRDNISEVSRPNSKNNGNASEKNKYR